MSGQSRRQFIKTSAAAAAVFSTFTISGTKSSGRVLGANDTINVAVAGIGGRGMDHIGMFKDYEKVRVTWSIDPDEKRAARGKKKAETVGGKTIAAQDVRKALDDENVDAFSIASCNHWHSLITYWAVLAGKDVYVEKPMSHNVHEGRIVVDAAKKHKRIVQHGTQRRSKPGNARIKEAIRSGKYGEVLVCRISGCGDRGSIGHAKYEPPPTHIDFDLWLGPAPKQPYHKNLVHYNWHWFWDFGNGDIANDGVHHMDNARWGLAGGTLPDRVWSLGNRFKWNDQAQTPNVQIAVFEFGKTIFIFEAINMDGEDINKEKHGYYTTEGMIRGKMFYPKNGGKPEKVHGPDPKITPGGPFRAFVHAMRTRKDEDNNAPPLEAHYSCSLCHLANISYRLGEEVSFSKKNKAIGDNKHVVETFEKVQEVVKINGMKLEETKYRMGRVLQFDPKTEKFVGDEQANRLLTREYRKPFVVPDKV